LLDKSILTEETLPKIEEAILVRPTFQTIHEIVLALTTGNIAQGVLTEDERKKSREFKKQDKLR